jgi:hypothetical protein
MTYDIHHRRRYNSYSDRTVIARNLPSLEHAKNAREVSGDLVVFHKTNRVVPSEDWLFDWEKEERTCYALKAIRDSIKNSYNSRFWKDVYKKIIYGNIEFPKEYIFIAKKWLLDEF